MPEPQERYEQLAIRGWNNYGPLTIEAVVNRITECQGASYGPYYDTVSMVLGALSEVTNA